MTGGGFYVVSFVSCSFCFMLKFSGRYVIKLLGVWRAQAPLFLVTGAVPAVGHMSVWPVSVHHHFPCQWLPLLPFWIYFLFRSSDSCLCEEATGVSRWLWPHFGFWVNSQLQLSHSCENGQTLLLQWVLDGCGRTCWQRGMLHYANKITSECSPFFFPSQGDLLWLFSSHFHCKIRHTSRFESHVQFICAQMVQT